MASDIDPGKFLEAFRGPRSHISVSKKHQRRCL